MATLSVKDLPDAVYRELKEAARSEGRSLNSYIVELLKAQVGERTRRRLMREGRAEFRSFFASLPQMNDSTALIRDDREHGH
jgi:hypothetical protein